MSNGIRPYIPGFYGKKRMNAAEWADVYMKKWDQDQGSRQEKPEKPIPFPAVCISRKIGVGALEVADILATLIHYRVVDREILEHMAKETKLSEDVVKVFDERYPGWASEFFTMLTSQRTFIKSDYFRQLVRTVTALADAGPTIFVGRGTHLILPRESVLSVRIVSSREFRLERLSRIMDQPTARVARTLDIMDQEQHDFFRRVYNLKETSDSEFDLIINRDQIQDAGKVAKIIACALNEKFETLPAPPKGESA